MTKYEIEDMIDNLISAAKESCTADINASRCQTSYDWKKAYEKEDKLEDLRKEIINKLTAK